MKNPLEFMTHYKHKYPNIFASIDTLRAKQHWPVWCYIPIGTIATLLLETHTQNPPLECIDDVGKLTACVTWSRTKGIYRFDETVLQSVWDTPIDEIPTQLLFRLPEWCVWVETPNDPQSNGFFAYLEYDKSGRVELRFCLSSNGTLIQHILHLDKPTVGEAIRAAWQYAADNAAKLNVDITYNDDIIKAEVNSVRPRLSLLLYLCSVNSDITYKGEPKQPSYPNPVKTKRGVREFPAAMPRVWDVGIRIGASLRRAAEQRDSKGGTHASPRPHIRRGHYHLFWTGPRRGPQRPVIKWLPPIPVNVHGDDLVATIRKVE